MFRHLPACNGDACATSPRSKTPRTETAGEAARAEEVYRADLRQHPRNGRSLHGPAESLERQGRTHEARLVERRVETAWQHADTPLRRFDVATGR